MIVLDSPHTDDLKYSLGSPEIFKVARVLALKHPNDVDIVVLKSLLTRKDTLALKESDFMLLDRPFKRYEDWNQHHNRLILISPYALFWDTINILRKVTKDEDATALHGVGCLGDAALRSLIENFRKHRYSHYTDNIHTDGSVKLPPDAVKSSLTLGALRVDITRSWSVPIYLKEIDTIEWSEKGVRLVYQSTGDTLVREAYLTIDNSTL